MRILKVTQSYFPFHHRGGPAFKVRSVARLLARANQDVTVLTADLGFDPLQIAVAGVRPDAQGWRSQEDGVQCIYLTTRGRYRNLTVNPGALGFCRRQLHTFDIVHIYGLYDLLGPLVTWYCRRLRIPYVIEPLGMTRLIDRGFALKRVWRGAVGDHMDGASCLIATSELEKAELLEEGLPPDRVVQRCNGIDLEEFQRLPARGLFRAKVGIAPGDRLVLFLGRIIPRKGADLLIDALSELGDEVKAVVAGPEAEPGYVEALRQHARTRGVAGRVVFCGPLYGEAKKAALVDADVFVLCSRYENFGNTAAEAIACSTPVIVSDQCGIAPLIQDRCGLVTQYDGLALARALKTLFKQPLLYQELKAGCHGVTADLSWDRLIHEMIDLYQRLARRRRPVGASDQSMLRAS